MRESTLRHSFLVSGLVLSCWAMYGFDGGGNGLDQALGRRLDDLGFTGRMQSQLEVRLGRHVNPRLANVGRLLWFDTIVGLNDDNTCGGCHSPTAGFGDTQSIAIGIDNNGVVGPHRQGPRNQRRSPLAINSAFYPRLMWNGRFSSNSGDPFDNSQGFTFPPPEGNNLSYQSHLLRAQAFIPPVERVETVGFAFPGNNDEIRAEVVRRLNDTPAYRTLFGGVYPIVRQGGPITFDMFAAATAEFEFSQTYANAPIDRFARGQKGAMSDAMKRGALLFFGKAKCVRCHAVSGQSNEMFSDFSNHVAGTPQIVPSVSNVVFDGPGQNEDFGLEQVTGDPADRYKFRSSPLRNIALQPSFFHNGSFVDLKGAIRYHVDPRRGFAHYTTHRLAPDLQNPLGPMQGLLGRLDPLLASIPNLTGREIDELTAFVGQGLLDPNATPQNLRRLIPKTLPSGRPPLIFERP